MKLKLLFFFIWPVCLLSKTPQITLRITDKSVLVIEQGDITQCSVQAIVNAANDQLTGGSGVCGAIFQAAGWQKLQKACDTYPSIQGIRCPVGHAKITDSFDLASRGISYIIHTVGPDCRIILDPQRQDTLLKQAYENTLLIADTNNIRSLAFPFISSAIYAFPKKRACTISLEAIISYLKHHATHITEVHVILFSVDDFNLFVKHAKKHTITITH